MTWRNDRSRGAFLGMAMTLAVAALHVSGALDRIEALSLDVRQRHANRFDVDKRLAHVDVDDSALLQIGRWPWPRDTVAELIRAIGQCGARGIAVDLLNSEPQHLRPDVPLLTRDSGGIEGPVPTELSGSHLRIINPDASLSQAIVHAEPVILGVEVRFPGDGSKAEESQNNPAAKAHAAAAERLAELLTEDFTRDEAALAALWPAAAAHLPTASRDMPISHIFAGAKRTAADRLVWPALRRDPSLHDVDAVARALGLDPARVTAADRHDLVSSIARGCGRAAVLDHCRPVPDAMRGADKMPIATSYEPPYYVIGREAGGFGAVTVQKEFDGTVRWLPLAIECDGRLLPHLGFAAVAAMLDLDLSTLRPAARGRLEVKARDGRLIPIPVDARGRVLLHWSPDDRDWAIQPRHIAAGRVLAASQHLRAAAENVRQQAERLVILTTLATPPAILNGREVYSKQCLAGLNLVDGWRASRLKSLEADAPAASAPASLPADAPNAAALSKQLAAHRKAIETQLRDERKTFTDTPPQDDEERARLAALRRAIDSEKGVDWFADLDALAAAEQREQAAADRLMGELRERLNGKFVFLGYAATALGDMASTAIDPSLPGVIAHATVANMFLQSRFLTATPRWIELGIILLIGAAATFVTSRLGIRSTILATLGLMAAYLLAATAAFAWLDRYVALVSPMLAAFATAVAVTFFRWWTTDKQRREIRAQFGQYTSRALADRIAEDPNAMELLSRAENRDVTCFFSDLKGFTTLAEQSEPARVRASLNLYLDGMTEVLDRHEALINKFMGDGIFAFFNSTVLPRADHPSVAVEAALECMAALAALRGHHGHPELQDLLNRFEMRIGLASGVAGVGDFGSSRKKDYTVIGDVANLAARLEPANKVFGTSLMVSGPTRDAVGDQYEFRYLAELQVKGKHRTVPVYEVLGRRGQVAEQEQRWAERFAEGVEIYKKAQWDECIVHFTRMLARRFDDAGCSAYIAACEEKKAFPPEGEWNGALELKEK